MSSSVDIGIDSSNSDIAPPLLTEADVRLKKEIELEEMLNGLKEKFASLSTQDPYKLSILTLAPQTWSINKIANQFGCNWQIAQESKELRASKGILGTTITKSGREIPEDVVRKVIDFYEDILRCYCSEKLRKSLFDAEASYVNGFENTLYNIQRKSC